MTETETTTQTLPTPTETAEAETTLEEGAAPAEPAAEAETQPDAEIPWATITDAYDLLDHEAVKPHLERRDRRVEQDLRSQYEGQLQQATRDWESTQLHQTVAGYAGNILEKLEGGDYEGSSRLLDKLEKLVSPYSEDFQRNLKSQGAQGASASLYKALTDSLDRRSRDEFEDLVSKGRNLSWSDALDEWSKLRFGATEKNLKAEIQKRDDTIARLKAEGRTDKGPSLTQSAPGGGRPSAQEYAAATSQQRQEWRDKGIEPLAQ